MDVASEISTVSVFRDTQNDFQHTLLRQFLSQLQHCVQKRENDFLCCSCEQGCGFICGTGKLSWNVGTVCLGASSFPEEFIPSDQLSVFVIFEWYFLQAEIDGSDFLLLTEYSLATQQLDLQQSLQAVDLQTVNLIDTIFRSDPKTADNCQAQTQN